MERLDREICYRALRTRDPRFDGRLFVGVTSTGIYCRPVCPARAPKLGHCRFFPSAAAAQEAGFRPCLRCRPETAPDSGSWRGTSSTVSRGLSLIARGALDGEGAGVDGLAEQLGVGSRHLRRLFQRHLGASPIAVAQTRRVLFAKQLIHETQLSLSEIAIASGFGSIRRFNETFQELFGRPPSALRSGRRGGEEPGVGMRGITIALRYRPPYDWAAMLSYLRARAIEGVERVDNDSYQRTFSEGGQAGSVTILHEPLRHALSATIRLSSLRALPLVIGRVRRLFDLEADTTAIVDHLGHDPWLAPLIGARPGLRVPGGWDGFEVAVRAVLGQQVTVEAGRRLASLLVRLCGTPVEDFSASAMLFPSPAQVIAADLSCLPMPRARQRALASLAQAAGDEPGMFEPRESLAATVERLRAISGVGDWTASYIAMRAIHEPDALCASDAALLRSIGRLTGERPTPAQVRKRAERWRPWRAYAMQHLWSADIPSLP